MLLFELVCFFFFKQKPAYELRISDWSSDVCSSDLVGHGRAAVIGDCIARVLDANGWQVRREFYYNDAGVQIENLARSVQARAKGLTPDDDGWPEDGYR